MSFFSLVIFIKEFGEIGGIFRSFFDICSVVLVEKPREETACIGDTITIAFILNYLHMSIIRVFQKGNIADDKRYNP